MTDRAKHRTWLWVILLQGATVGLLLRYDVIGVPVAAGLFIGNAVGFVEGDLTHDLFKRRRRRRDRELHDAANRAAGLPSVAEYADPDAWTDDDYAAAVERWHAGRAHPWERAAMEIHGPGSAAPSHLAAGMRRASARRAGAHRPRHVGRSPALPDVAWPEDGPGRPEHEGYEALLDLLLDSARDAEPVNVVHGGGSTVGVVKAIHPGRYVELWHALGTTTIPWASIRDAYERAPDLLVAPHTCACGHHAIDHALRGSRRCTRPACPCDHYDREA